MGLFPFLPAVDRCCMCTRKLKVACFLIVIWTMSAASHTIQIVIWPACGDLYDPAMGPVSKVLAVFKWIIFSINLAVLASSFAYLLGLLMSYPLTADVFICCGLASVVLSLPYSIIYIVQMCYVKCANPSDILSLIIYSGLWCYFILIVNSHTPHM